ncbi:MAG: hypothetical protein U9O82_07280 [Thermodesulfobacteriota bacterium]|nr:hypothetical protein [Thermodesulfobacteriota bacterium]
MAVQIGGCSSVSRVKSLFLPAEKPQDIGQAPGVKPSSKVPAPEEEKAIPQQQDEPSRLVVEHESDEAPLLEAQGNKKIGPLNFDGEKLPAVFDIISSMTGLDFKIDKALTNTEVTIFIKRDTSYITAIEMLCYKYGLAYEVNPDSISIKAQKRQVSALEKKLDSIRVGVLDFQDEKLSNVLKVISSLTNVNFVVKSPLFGKSEIKKGKAGKKKGEDENQNLLLDRKITIFLKDVSLKTALDALCNQYSLVYKVGENYIRIKDEVEDLTGAIRTIYYDIRPDGVVEQVKEGAVNISEGKIHLAVKGGFLVQVLKEISIKSGKNIVCRGDIDLVFVEIYITNVPVITAIEAICKKYNLWYEENKEKNYICLMNSVDFADQASLDFKIKTMVFNLKHASAPQLADSIAGVMGKRVEYVLPINLRSYEHLKEPDIEEEEAKIQAKKSDADITKNIKTPEFKENITAEKVGALLGTNLDLKLTAQDIRRINKQVGFAIISIFLRNNTIIASSTDDEILREIGDLIDKLDTPTPQVLIECRILKTTLTDDFTSFFQIKNIVYREKGGVSFGDAAKTWTAETFGAAGADALYNFVDDRWKMDLKMKLLKKDGIINIVGTPMIVAAQNSQAILETGMKNYSLFSNIDPIPPSFDDEGNITMPGYTTPRYKTVDLVGTSLKITPQINEDKSVTLKIYVSQTSINKEAATIQYSSFDVDGNPVTPWESTKVDVLSENSVNTIAVVPEDHTLAVGGLITEEDHVDESKVPFLGDIPLIGFFFKDHQTKKERTEMVFLLTPHIIMAPEKAGPVSEKALKGIQHPAIKEGTKDLFEYDEKWKKIRRK